MNGTSHDERLALRNASAMAQAQTAWDNAAEPAGNADIDERICAIEEAEGYLALARAELCNFDPLLIRVDRYMAEAMRCLMED